MIYKSIMKLKPHKSQKSEIVSTEQELNTGGTTSFRHSSELEKNISCKQNFQIYIYVNAYLQMVSLHNNINNIFFSFDTNFILL